MAHTATDAPAQIHEDLDRLKQRRFIAVASYIAVLLILLVALALKPAKATSLERNGLWFLALAGLFTAAAVSGAMVVGFPLIRKKAFFVVSGLSMAGMFGGLFAIMNFGPPSGPPLKMGLPCFAYGTTFSMIALAALGFISGRLWRRFPDPGVVLAIGVTAVGLSALHFSCGQTDPLHLIGFHVSPILIAYAAGRFALRVKQRLLSDPS